MHLRYARTVVWAAAAIGGAGLLIFRGCAAHVGVLHAFNGADGADPDTLPTVDSHGNVYGTTSLGGNKVGDWSGAGVVYEIDAGGHFKVIYRFRDGNDGGYPTGGLVLDRAGNLYGAAEAAGKNTWGAIFKIDPNGLEGVFHRFDWDHGAQPTGDLAMDSIGNLYGICKTGGASEKGVVFMLDTKARETVLHSFNGRDGAYPAAGVTLDGHGCIYGTTERGGRMDAGVAFKIDPQHRFSILHEFSGRPDGSQPMGRVAVDDAGNVFGTTYRGGAHGDGAVLAIDPFGYETIIHSFDNFGGRLPRGGLVFDARRHLYGATELGGNSDLGVLFKISTSGSFSILDSFPGTPGASAAFSGLARDSAGNLYGTTRGGGPWHYGVVFKFTP